MITAVLILVAVVGLFWLGYRHPRPRRWWLPRRIMAAAPLAAVEHQREQLHRGGPHCESAVAATSSRYRVMLASGKAAEIERELRGGIGFGIQVRALAELGSRDASRILERQLALTLSSDPVEQAAYWADVAAGLRLAQYEPALPAVLRAADATADVPTGLILAAECIAFPNFADAIRDPGGPLAPAAFRALSRVATECRHGSIDVASLLRVGLGDHLALVSESASPGDDPWLIGVMLEAERVSRRLDHWSRLLASDVQDLADGQANRLAESRDRRMRLLNAAPARMIARFPLAPAHEKSAALRCLGEFRADVTSLFTCLPDRRSPWWFDAIDCLTWSRSPGAGPVLAAQAVAHLGSRRRRECATLLAALRGHPCPEAEAVLLRAIRETNPQIREAGIGALGWWNPVAPATVLRALRVARTDAEAGIRQAALAALARLGERAAIEEIVAALHSEEPTIRRVTAMLIARHELTWLWPDLQDAAESTDADAALAACEALEQLRERILGVDR